MKTTIIMLSMAVILSIFVMVSLRDNLHVVNRENRDLVAAMLELKAKDNKLKSENELLIRGNYQLIAASKKLMQANERLQSATSQLMAVCPGGSR